MSLFTSFNAGVSGLQSSQAGLNTTAHNLANTKTQGYTRQQNINKDTYYQTIKTTTNSTLQVGYGTTIATIRQIRNEFLDKEYRKEVSRQTFYEVQYNTATEIEDILGETEGVEFNDVLSDIWQTVQDLSTNPESITNRKLFITQAESFLEKAQNVYSALKSYQVNLNSQIESQVTSINKIADQIAELNTKISAAEASGLENANDYRDARNLLLDQLAEYTNYDYYEDSTGQVNVRINNAPLVDESRSYHMACKNIKNQKYDEATNTNTFYLIKTDCDTATQQKLAEIELQGGETCGMAAWDDMVELYCFENMDKDNPTEWCYIVDTSTGSVERLPVEEEFYPAWYDDAALYELDYASGKRIIRRDRTTNEVSYINLPEQTINVYGAGDKWVIHRIVSPSPLPSNVDGDEYNAVFQNSEYEYDLFDAATGEMKKLYSYPTSEDFYWYRGQRDGTLYFDLDGEDGYPTGVDKLENGEMVQVLARDDPYTSEQMLENEQGELQWIVLDEGESVQVYDLNDGQSYRPAFVNESSQYASTGYPEMLLPGGQVFVTHGSMDAPDFLDKIAYATQDRAAYLSGSTDYTPVTMYTGK